MAYRNGYRQARGTGQRDALVSPRQAAALDKMAAEHGFANGSALLCDVASCDLAELGRKSRTVVQMFVDQAFQAYGRAPTPRKTYAYTSLGRASDQPAGALRGCPLLRLLRLAAHSHSSRSDTRGAALCGPTITRATATPA